VSQRVNEQIGSFAAIEPKFHFLQVGREMLCRNLMPRTHHAALEQGECRLYRVRISTREVSGPAKRCVGHRRDSTTLFRSHQKRRPALALRAYPK